MKKLIENNVHSVINYKYFIFLKYVFLHHNRIIIVETLYTLFSRSILLHMIMCVCVFICMFSLFHLFFLLTVSESRRVLGSDKTEILPPFVGID